MPHPPQLFITLARMHHIVNPAKFRKLKQCAESTKISGLVKTGKPGVVIIEGQKRSIALFLEGVRALRYLEFHHVDTRPLAPDASVRIADSKIGLHEVEDMKALIRKVNAIGMKEWFRKEMGMTGNG